MPEDATRWRARWLRSYARARCALAPPSLSRRAASGRRRSARLRRRTGRRSGSRCPPRRSTVSLGPVVVAARADRSSRCSSARRRAGETLALAQQLADVQLAPRSGLERGDHARRHAVVMKSEVRALPDQAAHRLGGLGARQHHQPRIVVHGKVIGLTGLARQRLHVGHRNIEQPVDRRDGAGQLEQPQRQRVGWCPETRQDSRAAPGRPACGRARSASAPGAGRSPAASRPCGSAASSSSTSSPFSRAGAE